MSDFNIEYGVLHRYFGNEKNVLIPDNITKIGDFAFLKCSGITSIIIPSSVTSIGKNAFDKCTSLTSIEIPSSVTRIEARAFSNCQSLTSIVIPNGVTHIGQYAFSSCIRLTNIEIPNSVKYIGESVFESCTSLTNIKIPNSVTAIGGWAFCDCKCLTHIEIPDSVTKIYNNAFRGCTNLTSIVIPNSVIGIGESAFDNLKQVKPQYNENGSLRAFKAFRRDWTCRDFKYKVGKSYHQGGFICCCFNGFHACPNPLNVFNYYDGLLEDLRFAEVELSGTRDWETDKVAASDIKIVRELTATELAEIYNSMEKV